MSTSKPSESSGDAPSKQAPSRRAVLQSGLAAAIGVVPCGAVRGNESRQISQLLQIQDNRRTTVTPIKQRASDDYRVSLQNCGGQLSNPIEQLFTTANVAPEQQFSIAIIGSGYGASVCAARLAAKLRPEHRICMIERGKEWIPGSFPDTLRSTLKNVRQRLLGPRAGTINNQLGLFNVRTNNEINTLSASALGGTSIINANVALKPDADVFRQLDWPAALSQRSVLDPYFERSAIELGLARSGYDSNQKIRSRRLAAEALSGRPGFFDRPPLSVTFDDRYLDSQSRNPHGMIQRPCTQCGDCVTGCNVGAKNTLVNNLLPDAKWSGTEIYTQVEVQSIEKCNGYYRLHLHYFDEAGGPPIPVTICSQMVILGAGSPSSAELLLQSSGCGMEFSQALGSRWSFNGDAIGFVMKTDCKAPIGGFGAHEECKPPVGPTVQTSVMYNRRDHLQHRMMVQDASIPRGVSILFSTLLKDRNLDQSSIMLAMGHDGAQGRIVWRDKRWQIDWPGLRDSRYRKMAFNEFERLAKAHGGWYKRLKSFGDNLVSVHPLGGCRMSDDPSRGVVNDLGQVYDGAICGATDPVTGRGPVHSGLYVADGSIMPSSLGVNPFMTICALSERIAENIVGDPNYASWFVQG